MKKCPTCRRPYITKGRWCYACERPIGRRHKFHYVGCYIQHDDCANPEMRLDIETPLLVAVRDDGPGFVGDTGDPE